MNDGIYILLNEKHDKINYDNLVLAIKNTFKNRKSVLHVDNMFEQLENLSINDKMMKLWKGYQMTAPYSSTVVYSDLFDELFFITNLLRK